MSNENSISLSQAEVDRLLGIASTEEAKPAKTFRRETIATPMEVAQLKSMMAEFAIKLRSHFKKVFDEPGVRKIMPSTIEQMCRAEFMEGVGERDFLFLVEIDGHEMLLKLDSFLFCALSGMSFNANNSSNRFQNETIRTMVAPLVVGNFLRAANRKDAGVKINPLYELPKLEGLRTETAGVVASFTWNEGFKSLGIEKMFFQRGFLDYLLA